MEMMRYCLLILIVLSASGTVLGAPFLVADPYPANGEKPVKFLVTIDGKTVESTPVRNADGSVYLKYDLGDLPDGSHAVRVTAVDAQGNESPPGVCSISRTGPNIEVFNHSIPNDSLPAPMKKAGAEGSNRYGAGTPARVRLIILSCLSMIIPVCAILLNHTNFRHRLSERRVKRIAVGLIILAFIASSLIFAHANHMMDRFGKSSIEGHYSRHGPAADEYGRPGVDAYRHGNTWYGAASSWLSEWLYVGICMVIVSVTWKQCRNCLADKKSR